ncbi:hypothetical protein BKA69DRAFT_556859 [Paraphysoderma sedebokerense]|nr:hypothetical protein BKA69DRAFT_556859 [Paraphysoderma sedebokerense]
MCDIGMELDNLAKLGLSSNRFTLTGLLLFFNRYDCPKLEDIDISSTLLDDLNGWELFLSLAKYKELSKLIIEGTKLRIEDTRINYNESSTPLFPNLVHLSLSNNRNLKISESFVQTLTQACPNLEVLNLSRLLYIGNSISRLSALKRLKRLNCSWVKSWGSEKLKLQELLKQNGSLEILDVAYTNLDFDSFLHGLTLNYCLKEMRCIGIPLSNHDFESLIQVLDSNRDCNLMNISYGCFDGENEIDPAVTDQLHQALLNIIRKSG